MKSWKFWLVPGLFALAGLLFLVVAVKPPIINGLPLNNTFLVIGLSSLTLALVFGAVAWRMFTGGGGPPKV